MNRADLPDTSHLSQSKPPIPTIRKPSLHALTHADTLRVSP